MKYAREPRPSPIVTAALVAGTACFLAGCATTQVNAQWSDPEFAGRSLRGQTVLVVCDADSVTAKRICQDEVAMQTRAAGATPVIPPQSAGVVAGPPTTNEHTLAAARAAGAKAIFALTIGPDAAYVSPGPSVGVGFGGWGGSGGGSVTGAGVSIGLPIGGGRVDTSYAANVVLTDVASARLMWSSKITTPASQSLNTQIAELARVGVGAAKAAGFF
jgi:hypothetical protein